MKNFHAVLPGDRPLMTPEEIAAAFAAEGWTVTTIQEACNEMERLSAGWRAAGVDAVKWEHLHRKHCGLECCDYLVPLSIEGAA